MLDAHRDIPQLERASGRAEVRFHGTPSRLVTLAQAGSAKAMLPKVPGTVPEIVFLNTAGGVTDGDLVRFALAVGTGRAVGTTQTAERVYRSRPGGSARVEVDLSVGPGGALHWVPQDTILFDGAALSRSTEVTLHADAEVVLAETLIFGREAMGETVRRLDLIDRRAVWRDGRPLHLDPVRLSSRDLTRPGMAGLGRARAVASVAVIAPDAADRLDRLRAVLPSDGRAAASAWDGRLVLRCLAEKPTELRYVLARALPVVTGRPLPRVWQG